MSKSWDDQPDEIEGAEVVLRNVRVQDRHVEIRSNGTLYWLTVGSLFGSQTVRCDSLETAIRALNGVGRVRKGKTARLPDGAELVSQ